LVSRVEKTVKSLYKTTQLLSEDIFSVTYFGRTVSQHQAVLIWEFKAEFLKTRWIPKLLSFADTLIKIRHPHLLPVLDCHYDGQHFYMIYEFSDNLITLDAYLASRGQLSETFLERFTNQLLSVLSAIEEAGVVAGTLNLSCVYLTPGQDVKLQVGVIQLFLLMRHIKELEVVEECIFLPPELLQRQEYGIRGDIYSFGMLLYFLYGGDWPYSYTTTLSKLKSELIRPPEPLDEGIPEHIRALILTCLQSDSNRRFDSFFEVQSIYNGRATINPVYPSLQPSKIQQELAEDLEQSRQKLLSQWMTRAGQIALVLVGLVVIYFAFVMYATSNPEIKVPNVEGQTQEQAIPYLEEQGFRVVIGGTRTDNTVPPGTVIETVPKPDEVVKSGRTIALIVSKGPETAIAPNFVGKAVKEAEAEATNQGLQVQASTAVFSREIPIGSVVEQTPSPDEKFPSNQAIVLKISKGYPVLIQVHPESKTEGKLMLRVQFQIPKGWGSQHIVVQEKLGGTADILYDENHLEGEMIIKTYWVSDQSTVDVFFNDDLAKSCVVENAQPSGSATSNITL